MFEDHDNEQIGYFHKLRYIRNIRKIRAEMSNILYNLLYLTISITRKREFTQKIARMNMMNDDFFLTTEPINKSQPSIIISKFTVNRKLCSQKE